MFWIRPAFTLDWIGLSDKGGLDDETYNSSGYDRFLTHVDEGG